MRLATLRTHRGERVALWIAQGDESIWLDLCEAAERLTAEPEIPSSLISLLEQDGPELKTARRVKAAAEADGVPSEVSAWRAEEACFASPIPRPGAFLDFYAFEEHVRRARARRGLEIVPEWYKYPVYYRSNQRSFLGPEDEVWFPPNETKMDFELELGAVLGKSVTSPSPDEAEAAIAGFCLLNDWSARAIQAEVMKVGLGPNKGKDFASSLGPWLVTRDEIGDLAELELEARVNGKQWSRNTLGTMNWSWGEMIAFAAEGVTFEAGDVFGSGTVGGGCGLELGQFLEPGDKVELDGGPLLGVLAAVVRRNEA
ncbi:MAG: fumarylacetoacetate hydrolase family protein [bacterium]|nr:fumarylacetoacetate hydrolase family protein [bacterium]